MVTWLVGSLGWLNRLVGLPWLIESVCRLFSLAWLLFFWFGWLAGSFGWNFFGLGWLVGSLGWLTRLVRFFGLVSYRLYFLDCLVGPVVWFGLVS